MCGADFEKFKEPAQVFLDFVQSSCNIGTI